MADPPPAGAPAVDQRDPQRRSPNEPVSAAALRDLGVLVWKVPPGTPEGEARLDAIKQARGYNYSVIERKRKRECRARASALPLPLSLSHSIPFHFHPIPF